MQRVPWAWGCEWCSVRTLWCCSPTLQPSRRCLFSPASTEHTSTEAGTKTAFINFSSLFTPAEHFPDHYIFVAIHSAPTRRRRRSFFHSLCFLDSYLVLLLQFGYHDNNWWLLLPGHLPEVIHCVHHRTLSGDVRLIVPQITLQNEPITQQGQHHSQNDENIPPPGSISSSRQNLPGFPKTSWRHVQRKNLLHFGIHK